MLPSYLFRKTMLPVLKDFLLIVINVDIFKDLFFIGAGIYYFALSTITWFVSHGTYNLTNATADPSRRAN